MTIRLKITDHRSLLPSPCFDNKPDNTSSRTRGNFTLVNVILIPRFNLWVNIHLIQTIFHTFRRTSNLCTQFSHEQPSVRPLTPPLESLGFPFELQSLKAAQLNLALSIHTRSANYDSTTSTHSVPRRDHCSSPFIHCGVAMASISGEQRRIDI